MNIKGYTHLQSGKVRELFSVDNDDNQILVVASDRISAFDYVLEPEIPQKGEILTQISLIWFDLLKDIIPNHLIKEQKLPDICRSHAMLCQKLNMISVECVARGYLTGSAYQEYIKTGKYLDINLPKGLNDGDKLPEPIFTPAIKAEVGGHDENVTFSKIVDICGYDLATSLRDKTLEIFNKATIISQKIGYTLIDTKFEFGFDRDGILTIGDEVLTPDSSRYLDENGNSIDKQYVRDFLLKESGWDKSSGVKPPKLPDAVVKKTHELYLSALERFRSLNANV